MNRGSRRGRLLSAMAVTLAAAGVTFLLLWFGWPLFYVLGTLIAAMNPNAPTVLLLVPYVVAPAIAAVFCRRTWWARWALVGFALHNIAFFVIMDFFVFSSPSTFSW